MAKHFALNPIVNWLSMTNQFARAHFNTLNSKSPVYWTPSMVLYECKEGKEATAKKVRGNPNGGDKTSKKVEFPS